MFWRNSWLAAAIAVGVTGCTSLTHSDVQNNLSLVTPSKQTMKKPEISDAAKDKSAPTNTELTPVRHDQVLATNKVTQTPNKDEKVNNPPRPLNAGITLDQAINACLLADPKLRAGFEAINQASADALTASLRPNPQLTLDGLMLPLDRAFTADAQGGPPQTDVNVSYPIDWFLFGKRAAAMAAAALGVRSAESDYADMIRQRVTEVAVAYFNVVEAKALLGLAQQDVDSLLQVEAATRKGREAGTLSQFDLNRVSLDVLNGQRSLREAAATVTASKAKLRSLLGRSDADPSFDVSETLESTLAGSIVSVEDALAQALANRPDLQSLNWKLAQAQASIESENRKAHSTVASQFGYTRQYQTKATGFPDANSWNVGVVLTPPLFDRNQGNRAKAVSVAAQTNQQVQQAVVELRAEIESVAAELNTAKANADAVAQEQLKLATAVRDAIILAYRAGDKPLIDVLDAQRNYRETYRAYYSSRANYWRALHKYQSAIGQQVKPNGDAAQPDANRPRQ